MAAMKLEQLPCPGLDPLAGFAAAGHFGRRFFWHQPSRDLTLLGVGAVASYEGGVDQAQQLMSKLDFEGPEPVALGGFAFAPDQTSSTSDLSSIWAGFGTGWLIIPRLLLMFQGDHTEALMAQSSESKGSECEIPDDEMLRRFCELAREPQPQPQLADHPADADAIADFNGRVEANYLACLNSAISAVKSETLEKVVVARAMAQPCALRPEQVLRNLMQKSPRHQPAPAHKQNPANRPTPANAIFACGDSQRVFMGATPELLADRHGPDITSQALAGSAQPQQSATLASDPKELAEHQLVVDYIQHKLNEAGVNLDSPASPEVLDLGNIVHLATQLKGTLGGTNSRTRALTALDLAAALHPSPSVCGLPVDDARRFITENEQLDRGWYAGPVGWTDARGDGTFHVALRSLMLDADTQTSYCFAGSGIVKGSVAEKENQETLLKLQTAIASVEL